MPLATTSISPKKERTTAFIVSRLGIQGNGRLDGQNWQRRQADILHLLWWNDRAEQALPGRIDGSYIPLNTGRPYCPGGLPSELLNGKGDRITGCDSYHFPPRMFDTASSFVSCSATRSAICLLISSMRSCNSACID